MGVTGVSLLGPYSSLDGEVQRKEIELWEVGGVED